jgi:uncharacterized FlaG/YvyC family protein
MTDIVSLTANNPASTFSVDPKSRSSVRDSLQNITEKANAVKSELETQSLDFRESQHNSAEHLSGLKVELADAIQTLNDSLKRSPTKANITHDETLNRFVVRIADRESGEIVREIPSEDLLRFARHLEKLKGILFDKTA